MSLDATPPCIALTSDNAYAAIDHLSASTRRCTAVPGPLSCVIRARDDHVAHSEREEEQEAFGGVVLHPRVSHQHLHPHLRRAEPECLRLLRGQATLLEAGRARFTALILLDLVVAAPVTPSGARGQIDTRCSSPTKHDISSSRRRSRDAYIVLAARITPRRRRGAARTSCTSGGLRASTPSSPRPHSLPAAAPNLPSFADSEGSFTASVDSPPPAEISTRTLTAPTPAARASDVSPFSRPGTRLGDAVRVDQDEDLDMLLLLATPTSLPAPRSSLPTASASPPRARDPEPASTCTHNVLRGRHRGLRRYQSARSPPRVCFLCPLCLIPSLVLPSLVRTVMDADTNSISLVHYFVPPSQFPPPFALNRLCLVSRLSPASPPPLPRSPWPFLDSHYLIIDARLCIFYHLVPPMPTYMTT
ncbi:hypothetical protein DFH06DRAFT_1423390 [Mycena polygramma]|nr:hypothetical protein DFH06DRAFT_1332304 [Mycena polygramma]KAJ7648694.1 hypothetical protein DFH06DRAFT_1423390 [Mycena polygramma]